MLFEIGAVSAGLLGAVAFGAGDFAGGRASLRLNGLSAVAVAQSVSAVTALLVLAVAGGVVPNGTRLCLAMLAGTFHVIAVFFIYQGIARGRVSVIAPIAGVTGIALPVLADMMFIQAVSFEQCAGFFLATAAIVLIAQGPSQDEDRSQTLFSIRFGLASGIGYGLADLCLGLMTVSTAEGGLAVARLTGACLSIGLLSASWLGPVQMAATRLASVSRESWALSSPLVDANVRNGLVLCSVAGLLDCFGQLGYVLSATRGQMSIAAALTAMYPAVSVALAIWLLKERIGSIQLTGLAASFGSILMLSQ